MNKILFLAIFLICSSKNSFATTTKSLVYMGEGRTSWFGGSKDRLSELIKPLALYPSVKLSEVNENTFYCAMRWNYNKYPKNILKKSVIIAVVPDKNTFCVLKPIDWGPHIRRKRFIDLSPKAIKFLKIGTDEKVFAFLLVNVKEGQEYIIEKFDIKIKIMKGGYIECRYKDNVPIYWSIGVLKREGFKCFSIKKK